VTQFGCAILGTVLGIGGALVAIASRYLPRPRAVPAPPSGVVRTGHRYCPKEMRVRAVILHADGSATCGDCGVHIPTTEDTRA
jgi:hypothetical protein